MMHPSTTSGRGRLPDLDVTRLEGWRAVRKAASYVTVRISAELESRVGISLDWYEILLHVYTAEDARLLQQDLDKVSTLSQSGISRLITKMVQSGYLNREPAASDKRNMVIALTSAGQDLFFRSTPIYHLLVQQYFGSAMTDDEAIILKTIVEHVTHNSEDMVFGYESNELNQLVSFGESVLSITSDSVAVHDALLVREAIEPLLLLDAAQHITPDVIQQMQASIVTMAGLIDQPEAFYRADWGLHRAVAELCGNTLLRSTYLQLLDVVATRMAKVVPTANLKPYLYERLGIHAQLVDAVASGNEDRVRAAAQAHHFVGTTPHWEFPNETLSGEQI